MRCSLAEDASLPGLACWYQQAFLADFGRNEMGDVGMDIANWASLRHRTESAICQHGRQILSQDDLICILYETWLHGEI